MSSYREDLPGAVAVLVGNPSPGSRTSAVARVVARALSPDLGPVLPAVELAEYGASLLDPRNEEVRRARRAVGDAAVLLVATPVHKAGYTGILKVFLDGLDATELEETVVVPVVLAASSAHGALADAQLRTVLAAVGAVLPVPSFVLEEHHLDDLAVYVEAWHQRFGRTVGAVARAVRPQAVGAR
jgi:FMN reductase